MFHSVLVLLRSQWPWYLSGPLLGLVGVGPLVTGSKLLGVSASYRSVCAIVTRRKVAFFDFDWRRVGGWNLAFVLGMTIGGTIAALFLTGPEPVRISAATRRDLAALGITDLRGLVPRELFTWKSALSPGGLGALLGGGFLVGFGSGYAGGCTSGHGIMGLADRQLPSVVAVACFFVGATIANHVLLPLLLTR